MSKKEDCWTHRDHHGGTYRYFGNKLIYCGGYEMNDKRNENNSEYNECILHDSGGKIFTLPPTKMNLPDPNMLNATRQAVTLKCVMHDDGKPQWIVCDSPNKIDDSKLEIMKLFEGTPDERTEYRLNGELHRENGPAVERVDGSKAWFLHGKNHREGGPACEYANGDKAWWLNGELHREDGPAIEHSDGDKIWCLNGVGYSEEEFNKKMNDSKLEIKKLDEGTYRERTEYRLNGKLHREDGPAREYTNGNKFWYLNGKSHRKDGPAKEYANGYKEWYFNDLLHREDGPAVEFTSGNKSWYLDGKQYSEEKFNKKMSDSKLEIKTLDIGTPSERTEYSLNGKLHRENGPAIEYADGKECWSLNGKWHRENGPAIECRDGTKEWWLNGDRHREDGPACEYADGHKEWYQHGLFHREDGPAYEYDGGKSWYRNGKLHRVDGPAVEKDNGHKEWYVNGLPHRENGPAIERANGTKFWYLEGKEYSEEEFNKKMADSKLEIKKLDEGTYRERTECRLNGQLHRENGPAIEYSDGTKHWFLNGKHHREDGPAVEWAYGAKEWWLNGKRHRENGPAHEGGNGYKRWFINGKLHREDGPALEYADGTKSWYLNGEKYSEEEFNKKMNDSKLEIKTLYAGTVNERTEYRLNGFLHREDGPAVEYPNGHKEWYRNNSLHRENGPAVEYANGAKFWYLDGKEYYEEEFKKKMSDSKWEIKTLDAGTPNERTEYLLNGKLHREDGPAVEFADGTKQWLLNGNFHRENGPACESADGNKYWYRNGQLHREDGPACEYADGKKYWFLEEKEYSKEEFNKKMNDSKLEVKTVAVGIYSERTEYRLNGKLHREDGPAIEFSNGNKEWWLNGNLHRENGPAVECTDGNKYWYLNGKLHREDGPAVEYANGPKTWCIAGKSYDEEEFKKEITKIKLIRLVNKYPDKNIDVNFIIPKDQYFVSFGGKKYEFDISTKKGINECNEFLLNFHENQSSVVSDNQEKVMTTPTFIDNVKSSTADAAYRVAGKQLTKGSKKIILKLLKSQGIKKSHIKAFSEFLETDFGESFISVVLGFSLSYVPGADQNEKLQHLATELRVEGIASATNLALTHSLESFLPFLLESVNNTPEIKSLPAPIEKINFKQEEAVKKEVKRKKK